VLDRHGLVKRGGPTASELGLLNGIYLEILDRDDGPIIIMEVPSTTAHSAPDWSG
jgi:hypothetical protein